MRQFDVAASKILKYAQQQVPECLYVMGFDPESDITLSEMLKFEQYFYKDVRK